jgi:hypothetical protein
MRIFVAIFILLLGVNLVYAQKFDYNWIAGGSGVPYFNTTCPCWVGGTKFNYNPPQVLLARDTIGINFNRANASISDSSGSLLFYSNETQVYNAQNNPVENGDTLEWDPLISWVNPGFFTDGDPYFMVFLTLPNPQGRNLFDLFYFYIDTINGGDVSPNKLLRATVDMNANNGLGQVTQKDIVVLNGFELDATVSAVKHANGRDWWICTNRNSTNCHEVLYYNGSDSLSVTEQCGGAVAPHDDFHACRFSPDGNFYVTINDSGSVSVFNFDRCGGILTLKEQFILSEVADSDQWWPTGMEFSADSRFLYIFCQYRIFQYDMTANPISSSKDTIATYRGFDGFFPIDYSWGQIGPDGKIYINNSDGGYVISVIDSPDGKGQACNFRDHSIELPTYIDAVPYYPNYRLGALAGSPCDTIPGLDGIAGVSKEQTLRIYPNPASDYTIVDYGFTDWSKGGVSLAVMNDLGQVVYQQQLPMYSGYQKIDISRFASGVYMAFIKRGTGVVAVARFVKSP